MVCVNSDISLDLSEEVQLMLMIMKAAKQRYSEEAVAVVEDGC